MSTTRRAVAIVDGEHYPPVVRGALEAVDDLVAHVTGKVLDALGVEHALSRRWSGPDAPPPERGLEGASRPPAGDEP